MCHQRKHSATRRPKRPSRRRDEETGLSGNANTARILPTVRLLLPTLAKAERKAAQYLLDHQDDLIGLSLVDLAARSGSSQASIIRLCKTIGLDGFKQLKTELARQARDPNGSSIHSDTLDMGHKASGMAAALKEVFSLNARTLDDTFALYTDEYDKALKAILGARQMAFFSIGNAHMPCQYAYFMFRRIGYYCSANTDPDMQMIDASNLEPGDVAIAVSHTGQTRNVVAAMELARKRGAKTICITKHVKSPLTRASDIRLFTATSDASVHMEVVARRIAEYAILEAFYHAVRSARPETETRVLHTSTAMQSNKLPGMARINRK